MRGSGLTFWRLPWPTSHLSLFRSSTTSNCSADITPPFRRPRDSTSVLRALASCVRPVPEGADFRIGADPWLGATTNLKSFLLARAKGRLAARLTIRDYFPNDIAGVAKEIPRVDRWLPLQTPDSVLARFSDGSLSAADAMDRLILLLASQHAWKLYNVLAPEEKWSTELLHRLLDLLCATNSGAGGAYSHEFLNHYDLTCLPDPDELYFSDELGFYAKQWKNLANDNSDTNTLSNVENVETQHAGVTESTTTAELEGQVSLSNPETWLVHGSAEQLFIRERDKLSSPTGYCSMVRGAAKFRHPQRALEMAELAWAQPGGNNNLSVATYNALLRSMHYLSSVQNGEEDVWPHLLAVLERLSASGQSVNVGTFVAVLHSLSVASFEREPKPSVMGDRHISVAFGLLSELRRLGLEPSLGVMANLLKLVHFTRAMPPEGTDSYPPSYSCVALLDTFLSELELRFQETPPSRVDAWDLDDYLFFPMAMQVASKEYNLELCERIDHLLMGEQDRRFFLSSSLHHRNYVYSYCMLIFSRASNDLENPARSVKRAELVYQTHCGLILVSNKLTLRLIEFLGAYLPGNSTEATECAYRCLGSVLTDLLDLSRFAVDLRSFKGMPNFIQLLSTYAYVDPLLAASLSSNILNRLTQADRKAEADSSKPPKTKSIPTSVSVAPDMLEDLIKMMFPACLDAAKNIENFDLIKPAQSRLKNAVLALQGWSDYTVQHKTISWKWAPQIMAILWHLNDGSMDDTLLRTLEQLSTAKISLTDDELKMAGDWLNPLLDAWESQAPPTIMDSASSTVLTTQRQGEVVQKIRHILKDIHPETSA